MKRTTRKRVIDQLRETFPDTSDWKWNANLSGWSNGSFNVRRYSRFTGDDYETVFVRTDTNERVPILNPVRSPYRRERF